MKATMTTPVRLAIWGHWASAELSHLYFTKTKIYESYKCLPLTDEELQQIDSHLAKLKQEDELLFSVIKGRFLYHENYKQLAKRLHKSVRVIGALISEAIQQYEVIENAGKDFKDNE